MTDVIQSLWVGDRLSTMEQLSIRSFLAHGHEYHLYTYTRDLNAPEGTVLRDASAILPASAIFQYRDSASYSGFSNYFRYKLLLQQGGWWVDTDMVCLKPFEFGTTYVVSSECSDTDPVPNTGAIRCPPDSPAMRYAWEFCRNCDPLTLEWGQTGPRLMREIVAAFHLEEFVQSPETFCPIGWKKWRALVDVPTVNIPLTESTAVHLWNEMWRRDECDKDGTFPAECLYEQLKARYLAPESPRIDSRDSRTLR